MTIDVFEVNRTKEINRESDLDALVIGDSVKVYLGHNYGELISKAQEMTYVGGANDKMSFSQNGSEKQITLYKNRASCRDGVLVYPQQNGRTDKYYNKY